MPESALSPTSKEAASGDGSSAGAVIALVLLRMFGFVEAEHCCGLLLPVDLAHRWPVDMSSDGDVLIIVGGASVGTPGVEPCGPDFIHLCGNLAVAVGAGLVDAALYEGYLCQDCRYA